MHDVCRLFIRLFYRLLLNLWFNKYIKCSGCRKWNFRFLNFKHFTRVYTLNSLVVQSLWKTLSRMLICSLLLVLFMFKRSNSALVFRTYKLLPYWIPHVAVVFLYCLDFAETRIPWCVHVIRNTTASGSYPCYRFAPFYTR
jgi:hypothetical protein